MYTQTIQVVEAKLKMLHEINDEIQSHVNGHQRAYNNSIVALYDNRAKIDALEKELDTINQPQNSKQCNAGQITELVSPKTVADVERMKCMLSECAELSQKVKDIVQNL